MQCGMGTGGCTLETRVERSVSTRDHSHGVATRIALIRDEDVVRGHCAIPGQDSRSTLQ